MDECLAPETYVKGEDTSSILQLRLQLYPWVLKDKSFTSKWKKGIVFCTDCRIFRKLAHVGNSAQWVIDCVVVQTDIVMQASPSTANVERSYNKKLTVTDKLNKRRKVCAH